MLKKIGKLFKNPTFLCVMVLVLGLVVRLYKITSPIADWHSWRQADTASVTRIYLDEGLNLLLPRYYDVSRIQTGFINIDGFRMVEFPIFNLFHLGVNKLSSQLLSFDATGRLTTVLISLVTAWGLYSIGTKTIGKYGGVLASAFFLFIPYSVFYSRVVLPDPLAVCFGVIAIAVFLKYYTSQKLSLLYISAGLFALSLLIKPFFAVYLLFPVYLIAASEKGSALTSSKGVIKYLTALLIVFLPFFAWRIWENKYAVGIPHFEWAFNGDMIRFKPSFWRWIFAERIGNLILGMWGLIPFGLGIVLAKKRLHYANVAWFAGTILYIFIVATANVRHDYYQIPLVPAIALLCAQGIVLSWSLAKPYLGRILLLFSIFMMLLVGFFQVKEYYKINRPEMIEAGNAVQRLVPKNAKIIAPMNGDTAFLYQTNRFGWPVVDNDIKRLIEWGAKYYVSINYADPDTIAFEKRFTTLEKTEKYIIFDLTKPL